MNRIRTFSLTLLLGTLICGVSYAENIGQLGLSYSREFYKNSDISQYEIFWRHKLPYTRQGTAWNLATALEAGAAVLDESGSDHSSTGRFSLMPQLHLSSQYINFIAGFGAGVMGGETAFTAQDLGGPFFLSSKLGLQFLLGSRWGVEYAYYHQSNGGIYSHNASLNMHNLAITFRF